MEAPGISKTLNYNSVQTKYCMNKHHALNIKFTVLNENSKKENSRENYNNKKNIYKN